jgi:hypothetical protein
MKDTCLGEYECQVLDGGNGDVRQHGKWLAVGRDLQSGWEDRVRVVLRSRESGAEVAAATVWKAERSPLVSAVPFQPNARERAIVLDDLRVAESAGGQAVLPGLLYLALREGRILLRPNVLVFASRPDQELVDLLGLRPLRHVVPVSDGGGPRQAHAQLIDAAMYRAFGHCHGSVLDLVQGEMTNEIVRTVETWAEALFRGPWARAIYGRTLTREQYVYNLFNFHGFVRYSTRHLSRAVGCADDEALRAHLLSHLREEINHEKIIERDLYYLQEDVDYLKTGWQPIDAVTSYLAVQESTVAYHHDPVLFMALPLAAESVAAFLTGDFLSCVYDCIAGWGVAEPRKAARFFTSHTGFDGGEDGHWNRIVKVVGNYVRTESRLRQFLGVLKAAMSALDRAYNAFIEDLRIWEPLC